MHALSEMTQISWNIISFLSDMISPHHESDNFKISFDERGVEEDGETAGYDEDVSRENLKKVVDSMK